MKNQKKTLNEVCQPIQSEQRGYQPKQNGNFGYQPQKVSSTPPPPPTSGSNAVKPKND